MKFDIIAGARVTLDISWLWVYIHICAWPWAQCSARCNNPQSCTRSQCRGYAYRRTLPRQRDANAAGGLRLRLWLWLWLWLGVSGSVSLGRKCSLCRAAIERQSSIFKMAVKPWLTLNTARSLAANEMSPRGDGGREQGRRGRKAGGAQRIEPFSWEGQDTNRATYSSKNNYSPPQIGKSN